MKKKSLPIKIALMIIAAIVCAYLTTDKTYTLVTLILSKKLDGGIAFMVIAALLYMVLFMGALMIWDRFTKAGGRISGLIIPSIGIPFIMLLFMPIETMISNYNDYSFSVMDIFRANAGHFLFFVAVIATGLALLGGRLRGIASSIICAVYIDMYVQYMFFNKTLGLLNGGVYNWREHGVEAMVNMVLMLLIVVATLLLALKNSDKCSKVTNYLAGFVTAIMLVAFLTLFIQAPEQAFQTKNYICDPSEQYMVSGDENIIIFIFDAADNSQLAEVTANESKVLDSFNDFTIYTNTCSICDVTGYSLPQMFSGSDFEANYADYEGFYDRLHDNGYVVNFYGYDNAIDSIGLKRYFDNYKLVNDGVWIDYKAIFHDTVTMSAYRVLPLMLKETINTAEIDFTTQVHVAGFDEPMYYNDDFSEHMQLTLREDGRKCMTVNLLYGTHGPQEDYAVAMEECLWLAAEYIAQLKEYGVYDASTIIITSDHGAHDDIDSTYTYQFAATPVFMIKEANKSSDLISYNDAPIYHTDFLATILISSGLYDANDGDRFGTSIYDFSDTDMRERRWYNRNNQNRFEYYTYTYTGDTNQLREAVAQGSYTMFEN